MSQTADAKQSTSEVNLASSHALRGEITDLLIHSGLNAIVSVDLHQGHARRRPEVVLETMPYVGAQVRLCLVLQPWGRSLCWGATQEDLNGEVMSVSETAFPIGRERAAAENSLKIFVGILVARSTRDHRAAMAQMAALRANSAF